MPEEFEQQLRRFMATECALRDELQRSSQSPQQRAKLQRELEATISQHAKLELRIWRWELAQNAQRVGRA